MRRLLEALTSVLDVLVVLLAFTVCTEDELGEPTATHQAADGPPAFSLPPEEEVLLTG